jgi:flagellar hook assembly protein FlgD
MSTVLALLFICLFGFGNVLGVASNGDSTDQEIPAIGIELLEPEKWIGKEFEILEHIDISEQLKKGNWLVVLYHHDCPSCIEAIPKIEAIAKELSGNENFLKIAYIAIPPYSGEIVPKNTLCSTGKLSNSKEWFVTTPVMVLLSNGITQYACENTILETNDILMKLNGSDDVNHDSNQKLIEKSEYCRGDLLRSVELSKVVLDIGEKEAVNFGFDLERPANISVHIMDSYGQCVCSLFKDQQQDAGKHSVSWNGKDNDGEYVPNGEYYLIIEATDSDGSIEIYDIRKAFAPKKYEPINFTAPQTGLVSYHLDNPCKVRIRVGVKNGPMLREIISYEARPKGHHNEYWDAEDSSGNVNLRDFPELQYTIEASTLSDECLIVVGGDDSKRLVADKVDVISYSQDQLKYPDFKISHVKHQKESCRPPRFTVNVSGLQDEEGEIISKGDPIALQIKIHEDDLEWVSKERFNVAYFIDGEFVDEIDDATDECTFELNSSLAIHDGQHILTVCVYTHADHWASQSRYMIIGHERRGI